MSTEPSDQEETLDDTQSAGDVGTDWCVSKEVIDATAQGMIRECEDRRQSKRRLLMKQSWKKRDVRRKKQSRIAREKAEAEAGQQRAQAEAIEAAQQAERICWHP